MSRSWAARARTPGGLFGTDKTCPPVEDCTVKNFLGTRRDPAPARPAAWPHAGRWEPARARAKGDGS